ncbi:hypothetical protein P8C59_006226 [Phyllachora maydis]|uniref:Uncharacterized protein n=1 Tax=Phyllachora maydis TaxID=1825666 RepID=A0AAD9MGG3_9PEZI|nr:hypothetical protein P8C59_006226 [Phyllachora maydis]
MLGPKPWCLDNEASCVGQQARALNTRELRKGIYPESSRRLSSTCRNTLVSSHFCPAGAIYRLSRSWFDLFHATSFWKSFPAAFRWSSRIKSTQREQNAGTCRR